MTIELITFDLDDTLWDTAPVIVSAELALREWLAEQAPQLGGVPTEHLWAIREQILTSEPQLKYRISDLRRRVLLQALREAGYAHEQATQLAGAAFEVFLQARHQLDVFPEVQPTLEQLARSYRLGVVTNGNADVRRLGLAEYFQFALCAEDIGVAKPDPRLFHEALLRAGNVVPGAAVHIGDHPGDDIAGAQQAGFRAIWYNPEGKPWGAVQRPDGEIGNLSELPELLARWRG